ncbi:MAG: prolyl oligopeptidase family serine peptidase [Polyangia bacterium]
MRSFAFATLLLFVAAPSYAQWSYPPTKTVDVTDRYFGKTYKDPYRWLEDLKDRAVEAWFKAQAQVTDDALDKIPARDKLAAEWLALDKLQTARYSAIQHERGRVFYKKTLGGENVGKLYYRVGWRGAEKLLFDPSTFAPKGAKPGDVTTIQDILPSPDGKYVALGFSAAGAEYSEIRVLDVDRGKLLPETMYPSYGPIGWTMDSKSLFYDMGKVADIKSPEIELNRKTRLHRLGAEVASDVDFFSNESNPELDIAPKEFPGASIDESYPDIILGSVGTVQREMRLYWAPVAQMKAGGKLTWKELCKTTDKLVRGLEFHKGRVYAVTHADAPRYKVVSTSLDKPDWAHAETVMPEASDSIRYITKSKSYLFIVYSDGIVGRIVKYSLATGKAAPVKLPESGSVDIHCPDFHTDRCIVFTTSWIQPTTLWDFDAQKDRFAKSIFNTAVTYPGFDQLTTEEVEVPGHDGTMVPLSIIHRKDLKLDGSSSAILEGYGAYGFSRTPGFSVRTSIALHNVVLAYAHPRGGSEKGEAWYRAGYKTTKPNTWKDFISCAEYLIKKGYTSANKLAGTGTSAGGILISRAITERPELFGAAICNVGCANAMRMEFSPNGPVNTPEFGTVKDPTEAAALYEMDGVAHVKPGVKYPAVLGVAGWNDPRVAPWQPGKFVAALQSASKSGKPVLMKVNYDNGHFTEEKLVTFKNFAGQYAFVLWQTGHPEFQPVTTRNERSE